MKQIIRRQAFRKGNGYDGSMQHAQPHGTHVIFMIAYFTDPVMPSVNCFCSTKKMIIVGIEQNRTPIISTP